MTLAREPTARADDGAAGRRRCRRRSARRCSRRRGTPRTLRRRRCHAGDEMRLVGVVHVAPALARGQRLDVLARLVEVASVLEHFGAERAHRGGLVGVVADRHDDAAANAVETAGQRDGLTVIAGARADDAAPLLLVAHLRDEIQAAANLERAGRIVVLVLDPRRAADPLVEQRMLAAAATAACARTHAAARQGCLGRSGAPCRRLWPRRPG